MYRCFVANDECPARFSNAARLIAAAAPFVDWLDGAGWSVRESRDGGRAVDDPDALTDGNRLRMKAYGVADYASEEIRLRNREDGCGLPLSLSPTSLGSSSFEEWADRPIGACALPRYVVAGPLRDRL
jgi:hypothetical protein